MTVDTYIDTILPYLGECTEAALCGPAWPCNYKVKARHQISIAKLQSDFNRKLEKIKRSIK